MSYLEHFTPDELRDMSEYDRRVNIECNRKFCGRYKKSPSVLEHGQAEKENI